MNVKIHIILRWESENQIGYSTIILPSTDNLGGKNYYTRVEGWGNYFILATAAI